VCQVLREPANGEANINQKSVETQLDDVLALSTDETSQAADGPCPPVEVISWAWVMHQAALAIAGLTVSGRQVPSCCYTAS
jgi:hypothetical protein